MVKIIETCMAIFYLSDSQIYICDSGNGKRVIKDLVLTFHKPIGDSFIKVEAEFIEEDGKKCWHPPQQFLNQVEVK